MIFVEHETCLDALASKEETERWQQDINPDKNSYLTNLESMVERVISEHDVPGPEEDQVSA